MNRLYIIKKRILGVVLHERVQKVIRNEKCLIALSLLVLSAVFFMAARPVNIHKGADEISSEDLTEVSEEASAEGVTAAAVETLTEPDEDAEPVRVFPDHINLHTGFSRIKLETGETGDTIAVLAGGDPESVQADRYLEPSYVGVNRYELAGTIWSTMSAFKAMEKKDGTKIPDKYYGLRGEQICALLGNWEQESGLDPTAVESVMYEPWTLGSTKQAAIANDFLTDFYWGTNEKSGYFEKYPNIFKAGIGLAQWTDTYASANIQYLDNDVPKEVSRVDENDEGIYGERDIITGDRSINEDTSEIMSESDEIFDEEDIIEDGYEAEEVEVESEGGRRYTYTSNGRNTRLMRYARQHGLDFYNGVNKKAAVWDCDNWIRSGADTKGTWCDPLVQIAYTLDTSNGDPRASWIHTWAETGGKTWSGDRAVSLAWLEDAELEGWTWDNAFSVEHGWDPAKFYVADDVVKFGLDEDTITPVGDNTGNTDDFRTMDVHLTGGGNTDGYYSTPNDDYVASVMYDEWTWENGKALSTSGSVWDRSSLAEARPAGINAARELALEYAEKSAGIAWHGRLDNEHGSLGNNPGWNDYSRACGHDYICENNPSVIFINENGIEMDGPYQHYGIVKDEVTYDEMGGENHNYEYGWIMDADPVAEANSRAIQQYKRTFKYIYRYHLYRYMTMYYTAQFLAEFEGVPGKALEQRQINALRWFQMWWDSGKSEPNVYAPEVSDFYKVKPEYARSIMENLK